MDEEFEKFWKAYPRKVCRKDAFNAFRKITPSDRAVAIEAIEKHKAMWEAEGRDKAFIPHASTWLNGERWHDEIEMPHEKIPEKVIAWWASEQGVMDKGRELGVRARGGESMAEYKSRVVEAARKAA